MGKPERGRETKGRGGAVDAAQRRPCAEPYRPGHPSTPSPHRISAESLSPTTICFNVVPTLSQSREEKEERRPEREGVRARKRLRERKRASAVASTAREPRLTTPRPTSSNWIRAEISSNLLFSLIRQAPPCTVRHGTVAHVKRTPVRSPTQTTKRPARTVPKMGRRPIEPRAGAPAATPGAEDRRSGTLRFRSAKASRRISKANPQIRFPRFRSRRAVLFGGPFRRRTECWGWLEMAREGSVVPADPQQQQQQAAKKKGQPSRSWILLDAAGQGTVLDVDKYAIMHRVQIHARDLRILDPLLSYPSTILGRERAIVLNLEHIKAIITAEEVLLRDPSDINVIPVVEELQRRLAVNAICQGQDDAEEYSHVQNDVEAGEDDESPFEFRALEVALEAICSFLAARTTELETAAYPALDELTSKISSRNLDRVRKLKSAMTRLTARVQKVRDELEQLLDDDDDMADLYLSRKQVGASSPISGSGAQNWFPASPTIGSKISRASRASVATVRGDEDDVEELEMLLEAYFMQIDGTLNKLTTLREYIDDTEDYINIQLDNHRNQLIQLELFLSSGTVCLSIYSLVAAIFGMNIPYDWNENHGYMFKWVVIVTGTACAFLFILVIAYARHKGLVGS